MLPDLHCHNLTPGLDDFIFEHALGASLTIYKASRNETCGCLIQCVIESQCPVSYANLIIQPDNVSPFATVSEGARSYSEEHHIIIPSNVMETSKNQDRKMLTHLGIAPHVMRVQPHEVAQAMRHEYRPQVLLQHLVD